MEREREDGALQAPSQRASSRPQCVSLRPRSLRRQKAGAWPDESSHAHQCSVCPSLRVLLLVCIARCFGGSSLRCRS